MTFEPKPGMSVKLLNGESIEFVPLAVSGPASVFVYAEAGKEGIVYKVLKNKKQYALKVFYPEYQDKRLIKNTEKLSQFKTLKGLLVTDRTVINKKYFPELINISPELNYSVLMPWIQGTVWGNLMTSKHPLQREQYFQIARVLMGIISNLEAQGLAHCDLSNNNFIIDPTMTSIELIDIEDMFAPEMPRPIPDISYGTIGYRTKWISESGLWGPNSDRFASAILCSEMITWHNKEVRDGKAGASSFFDEEEIGEISERYLLMMSCLSSLSSDLPPLFKKAWFSKNGDQCPPVADWAMAVNNLVTEKIKPKESLFSSDEKKYKDPEVKRGDVAHGVPPKMEISHSVLDFGTLQQSKNELQICISNAGGSELTGNFILAPWLETSQGRFTIQPGDERKIVVSIKNGFPKPQTGLEYRAPNALVIESNSGVEVISARYKLVKPPFYKTWLGLMIISFLGIIFFGIVSAQMTYQNNINVTATQIMQNIYATSTKEAQYFQATAEKQAQNERATATKQAQNERAIATKQAYANQLTSTAVSAISMAPPGISAQFTKVLFFETFSVITGNWYLGVENDDFYSGNREITNNSFVWTIDTVKNTFVARETIPNISLQDFYIQVDIKRVNGSLSDTCYGLAFRDYGKGYYHFEVCDDGYYGIYYINNTSWVEIGGWQESSYIQPGDVNRLGIAAKGSQFDVYINGQKVYSFSDDALPYKGALDLTLSQYAYDATIVEYDNVLLLTP